MCILDHGIDVRPKANSTYFLFKFKMCCNAAETTRNINNAFGPGTANECSVQDGSRSFAKEIRALKMRSATAGHWKLTTIS